MKNSIQEPKVFYFSKERLIFKKNKSFLIHIPVKNSNYKYAENFTFHKLKPCISIFNYEDFDFGNLLKSILFMKALKPYCIFLILINRNTITPDLEELSTISNLFLVTTNQVTKTEAFINKLFRKHKDKVCFLFFLLDIVNRINNPLEFKNLKCEYSKSSNDYFNKLCKRYFNLSLTQIKDAIITDKILNYLKFSMKNATEIANELGFQNVSNLTHFFKRKTDISPFQYRKFYYNKASKIKYRLQYNINNEKDCLTLESNQS